MTPPTSPRPLAAQWAQWALTLASERVRFCTHCAVCDDDLDPLEAALLRVCPRCGLGVLLTASRALVQCSGIALLVVTPQLRISAASRATEAILGDPDRLVGRLLLDVFDAGAAGLCRRAAHALEADLGTPLAVAVDDRLVQVRVGRCGDPLAALIALSP